MLSKLKTLREEREDGFTLIELLVVILIIGILAAIAIPVFLNQRQTANDGAVESDVKNAASQVETWIVGKKGAIVSIADGDITDVVTSTGVTLTVQGTTNDYCITGSHENGKNYSTADGTALTYSSSAGGLDTACSAASLAETAITLS